MKKTTLTGRICHKKTWCGLVMWVEYFESGQGWQTENMWKKAKEEDLAYLFENKFGK